MALNVQTANGTDAERDAVADLTAVAGRYDLTRWTFTTDVLIEEGAIPHSHPVLTLSTFNRGVFQLASLLHEQIHWFCVARYPDVERLYRDDLMPRYPEVPVGRPNGARDTESTYLHLLVCWLELDALTRIIDRQTAERVADGAMARGLYRWVYRTVLDDRDILRDIYSSYNLCIS